MSVNNLLSNNQNRILSFGSKNCPIDPFTVQTTKGPLFVQEMPKRDLEKTASFSFDVALNSFKSWEQWKNCSKGEKVYFTKSIERLLKHNLAKKDGNSTLLIAKDTKGDVKALFDLQSFDSIDFLHSNGFKDSKTAYIENCLVSAEYRSQGIGQKLIGKLLKTADNHFTDIFLCAENPAVNFYKRSGFSTLDTSNPAIKKISDFILSARIDRDDITLMSKSLNQADPWWARMVKLIK